MTEEAFESLWSYLDGLEKRIASGEIPPTTFPRYVFSGHKLVCEYTGTECFRCSCGHTWTLPEGQYRDDYKKDRNLHYSCPACTKSALAKSIRWYHEYDQNPKWECLDCKHQWRGKDGEVCPSCNLDYRNFKKKPD